MLGKRLGSQELADLAVYLRQQSFSVGVTQVEAAQRLLWRMAEQGVSKPATEMTRWLGPIFATNARDLDRFADLYTQWEHGPRIPLPPPKPKWRLLSWLTVAVLGTALGVALGIHDYRQRSNTSTQKTLLQKRNVPSQINAPSPSIASAAGSLRGDDGKPVAHARLLFAGQVSESNNKGEFSVTGKSFEPVLATDCDYDAVLFPIINRTDYDLRMVRKSQSSCTPGQGSSGPNDPRPRYRRVRLAVSALPMLVFLAWTIYVLWKRVGLRKWRGASNSHFAQIPLGDSADRVFPEMELQRGVQELRRPRPIPWRDLSPEQTVTATVENGGWFTPVYRSRQRATEYLVLIDRSGKRDQQACFADELLTRLKARGVYAQVCYFNSDPRTCTEAETGQSVAITDLSARFGQCQVWIVADSSIFFNAFTGRPERWVDLFQQWPSRLLLTPADPTDWGNREVDLADLGFEIVPASPRGLARIVKHLATSDVALDSYPPLLEERPTRWTSSQAPTKRETMRLRTELLLYLGRDGFCWLAACAEYPLIEWPLTLYLGNVLMQPEKREATLRKLVRLPWFRRGSMPHWLRVSLSKDKNLRKRVHQLFLDRLNSMPIRPASVERNDVDIAIERDYQRRIDEDEIWLSLLWGRDSGGLALPASGLRRLLFQRGRVWLGPRLAVLFVAALLSSGCIWWGMGFGVPSFNIPQPQVESIALDVAISQYPAASYFKAEYSSDNNVSFPQWCYQITQLVLGRSISLASPAPGAKLIPGAISRRNGDEGLYAGAGWSLVFQGDHIVAQKDYSVYQLATLSNGPTPEIPAAPSYGSTVGIDSEAFFISGSFENGYTYDPASTVSINPQTGLVVSARVVIEQTGEVFSGTPVYQKNSIWQWQNQGTLSGSLDFQDNQHSFVGYTGGVLTHAAYWTPSLGRNVVSAKTVLSTIKLSGPSRSTSIANSLSVPVCDATKTSAAILKQIADLYERTRQTMPSGDSRTARMTQLIDAARQCAPFVDAAKAETFLKGFDNESDGFRIVALGLGEASPSGRIQLAIDGIGRSHSPFEQYHALMLAQLLTGEISSVEKAELHDAIQGQIGKSITRADMSRWQPAQELLNTLSGSGQKIPLVITKSGTMPPLFRASGGVPPYRWSLEGSLPSGYAFDVNSGQIAGSCKEASGSKFLIRVTDTAGAVASSSGSMNCIAPVPTSQSNASLQQPSKMPTNITVTGIKPYGPGLELLLRYSFSRECKICFLEATLLSADQQRAQVNDRLRLSSGTFDVALVVTNSSDTDFVSNEIEICMVEDSSRTILSCQRAPFAYKWASAAKGGGLLVDTSLQRQVSNSQERSTLTKNVCQLYGEADQGASAWNKDDSCIIPQVELLDTAYRQTNFVCCGGGATSPTTNGDIPPGLELQITGGHYWSVANPKLVDDQFYLHTYCGPEPPPGPGCNVRVDVVAHYRRSSSK